MEFTFPNYYKEFSCIAGSCPDTCCAGWQIVIDNKTLKKYQHFKGPFHNRLHNDIDWKEHVFRQYNRRCAFLNEENLCDIYTEAGPKMLCDTHVHLAPFMIVAGDHATNDMSGEDDDSWKSILEKEGYSVKCTLKGLGEIQAVRDIFIRHTRAGLDRLSEIQA